MTGRRARCWRACTARRARAPARSLAAAGCWRHRAIGAPTPRRLERDPLRLAEVVIDAIHPALAPASGSPCDSRPPPHPNAGTPSLRLLVAALKEMTIANHGPPWFKAHRPCRGPAALANRAGAAGVEPHPAAELGPPQPGLTNVVLASRATTVPFTAVLAGAQRTITDYATATSTCAVSCSRG